MIPGRLYVRNFMSIGEVDISLKDQGLVLISGDNQDIQAANSNAAGKSSLFEALLWCYLGETYRDVNVDKVVRIVKDTGKTAKGGCAVVHEVEANGCTYRISRFRKDTKYKNRVVFEQIAPEHVDLSQGKAPDTDKMILKTLQIHPEILQQTTMIGQGMPWKFTDLKDADRKRVMTEMLSLHVWDMGSDKFRRQAVETQVQIEKVLSALNVMETQQDEQLQSTNLRRDELGRIEAAPPADPKEIQALEGQIATAQTTIKTLQDSLAALEEGSQDWQRRLDSKLAERATIELALQQAQTAMATLTSEKTVAVNNLLTGLRNTEKSELETKRSTKMEAKAQLDTQQFELGERLNEKFLEAGREKDKIALNEAEVERLKRLPDVCPTCNRPGVTDVSKLAEGKFGEDNQEFQADYEKFIAEHNEIGAQIGGYRDQISGLAREIEALVQQQVDLNSKPYPEVEVLESSYNTKIGDAQGIVTLKSAENGLASDAIQELQQKQSHCQQTISSARTEIDQQNQGIHGWQRRLGELQSLQAGWQAQIEAAKKSVTEGQLAWLRLEGQVQTARKDKLAHESLKEHYDWLATACKKIRSLSMDEALGFINERLRYYMDIFTDSEIQVVLLPETENVTGGTQDKIDIQITTAGGVYQSGSGGEKRRIDLSLYFALSDLSAHVYGSHITVLVCDEIMDSLDITGVYRCLDILKIKRDAGLSVFLTSQRTEILRGATDFDQWWVMQKSGGVSRLLDARAVA